LKLSRIVLAALACGAALAAAAVPLSGASPGGASASAAAPGCWPLGGSASGADPRGVDPKSPNPLRGLCVFVDHREPAHQDYRRASGGKATTLSRLALRPIFKWTGRFTKQGAISRYLALVQSEQPGAVPELVTLRHQGKQCSPHYRAGGKAEDERTKRWFDRLADDVGSARVIIAFEPDSIGTINCLARSRRKARVAVLRYGVSRLAQLPNATIYLEGTASDWKSARYTARKLKAIGISKVRGFMLNVTHYDWTIKNIRYGNKVSKLVGGKPFVVSTAYNGRGPVHYKSHRRVINVYCNPQFRGIGPAPTAITHFKKVDAFLYINRPGYSGAGGCNGAPAHAGTWWPKRALMFARYATQWVRPPHGTRFGSKKHISLCRLGAPLGNGKYSHTAPEKRCGR
jgi:endoglucanase